MVNESPPKTASSTVPDPWPAARVKALRTAIGLSQSKFASALGLTGKNAFMAVSKWENGRQLVAWHHHATLEGLEQEAREMIAQPRPASNGPVRLMTLGRGASPQRTKQEEPRLAGPINRVGALIRWRDACGCERRTNPSDPKPGGDLLRICGAHIRSPRYRPEPSRTEPRPLKQPMVPLPRGGGPGQRSCACTHVLKDHDGPRGRCWVCGTGHGRGCQRFRAADTEADAAPQT